MIALSMRKSLKQGYLPNGPRMRRATAFAALVLMVLLIYGLAEYAGKGTGPKEVAIAEADSPTVLVGSAEGTRYHYLWCAGGSSIKEGNRIYFEDQEEARAFGYTPAKNCRGL